MITKTELGTAREWVDAGGLRTYYEAGGDGDPLLMLHGGFATVETFADFTPRFTGRHRVYSPERRAHGRMPDPGGPLTYEVMAEDTIAFLDALGIGPAHLVGWSDGANVALIVALRRPDLVRKLVIIGTAVNLAGGTPFARAMSTQMTVDHLPPMLVAAYGALSPDGPEHLPVVFDRLIRALAETTLELADLARIPAPTLIMAADDDLVSISHLEAMRDALPDAQLAIVPGTSHALPLEKPALTAQLILEFLDAEQVTPMMPTRHHSG